MCLQAGLSGLYFRPQQLHTSHQVMVNVISIVLGTCLCMFLGHHLKRKFNKLDVLNPPLKILSLNNIFGEQMFQQIFKVAIRLLLKIITKKRPSSVFSVAFLTRNDGMMSAQYLLTLEISSKGQVQTRIRCAHYLQVSSQVFSLFRVVATQFGATTVTVFGIEGRLLSQCTFFDQFWVG